MGLINYWRRVPSRGSRLVRWRVGWLLKENLRNDARRHGYESLVEVHWQTLFPKIMRDLQLHWSQVYSNWLRDAYVSHYHVSECNVSHCHVSKLEFNINLDVEGDVRSMTFLSVCWVIRHPDVLKPLYSPGCIEASPDGRWTSSPILPFHIHLDQMIVILLQHITYNKHITPSKQSCFQWQIECFHQIPPLSFFLSSSFWHTKQQWFNQSMKCIVRQWFT